jgi:hypothetical protein
VRIHAHSPVQDASGAAAHEALSQNPPTAFQAQPATEVQLCESREMQPMLWHAAGPLPMYSLQMGTGGDGAAPPILHASGRLAHFSAHDGSRKLANDPGAAPLMRQPYGQPDWLESWHSGLLFSFGSSA